MYKTSSSDRKKTIFCVCLRAYLLADRVSYVFVSTPRPETTVLLKLWSLNGQSCFFFLRPMTAEKNYSWSICGSLHRTCWTRRSVFGTTPHTSYPERSRAIRAKQMPTHAYDVVGSTNNALWQRCITLDITMRNTMCVVSV